MKRALQKVESKIWYFDESNKKNEGAPPNTFGDLTGVRGDLTGVRGDLTGVRGDLSGVWGDLTECELTDEERKAGVHVDQLIMEKNP